MKFTNEFVDELSWYEHDSWARWVKHLFSKCSYDIHGNACIPKELWERWQRQMDTSYFNLSEQEKESDREEVRKILPIIEGFFKLQFEKKESNDQSGLNVSDTPSVKRTRTTHKSDQSS